MSRIVSPVVSCSILEQVEKQEADSKGATESPAALFLRSRGRLWRKEVARPEAGYGEGELPVLSNPSSSSNI